MELQNLLQDMGLVDAFSSLVRPVDDIINPCQESCKDGCSGGCYSSCKPGSTYAY